MCVCVYVYVYISRVILAHHSLFVTVDTPDRIRSRENVINWPCRDIARFIRRNLSVCRFLVVDLLPLSKYSIILVGGDRDRPWIELISPLSNGAAGFRATAFKQLVQQRSKRFHSTAGFAQFHHFPASFRKPKASIATFSPPRLLLRYNKFLLLHSFHFRVYDEY